MRAVPQTASEGSPCRSPDEEGTFNSTAPSPYSGYFGNVSGDTAYTGATTGYTPAPRRSSPPPSAGATPPQPSAPPSAPPHKPAPTPPPTPCPILVCPH